MNRKLYEFLHDMWLGILINSGFLFGIVSMAINAPADSMLNMIIHIPIAILLFMVVLRVIYVIMKLKNNGTLMDNDSAPKSEKMDMFLKRVSTKEVISSIISWALLLVYSFFIGKHTPKVWILYLLIGISVITTVFAYIKGRKTSN